MGNRNKGAKTLQNGRNATPTDRFTRLPHKLLISAAYRSLSPSARALLVELATMENAHNNGDLWLSERDAARRIGVSCQKVVRNAFSELVEAGFVAMTKNSHFNVKTGLGRARAWRLTWLFNVADRKSATNEWQSFLPKNNRAMRRMDAGLRALSDYRKEGVQKQNTEGKSPYTPSNDGTVEGDLPDTDNAAHGNPSCLGEVKQGDLPSHTAVTRGRGFCDLRWRPTSGSRTCPTAFQLWMAHNGGLSQGHLA